MRHPLRLAATVVLVALLSACAEMKSTPSLTDQLAKQVGVTANQAEAGVGSILELSKNKLSPSQFDQLIKPFPSADKYLKEAQNALGPGTNITDMNGLSKAFTKLGMSPDMVGKFKPVVLDYAGKVGGSSTKNLLAGVLQ